MTAADVIAAAQPYITNRLDGSAVGDWLVAGIIGDGPSYYSKSPALWNAAFRRLNIQANYLPFDVEQARLAGLLGALKTTDRFLGVNVTVPHKVHVMAFLDDLDACAERIGAVNTIVRTAETRLAGYNTDGEGFIQSILERQPDRSSSFVESLTNMDVLLLGAGGSARAVAFHVADRLGKGRLFISNRTVEHAVALAADIQAGGGNAEAIGETDLPKIAPVVGLIVNSTTKGQGGRRKLADGRTISLELYSALAPAHPTPREEASLPNQTAAASAQADIEANHQASLRLAQAIPSHVRFYDLIYHPEETIFLRHGRSTGHPTMNGKAMIINQAVLAFCRRICRNELQARRIDTPGTHQLVLNTMHEAW